jgi:hypothetical protein
MHRTKNKHDANCYGIHGFEIAVAISACDTIVSIDAPTALHDSARASNSFDPKNDSPDSSFRSLTREPLMSGRTNMMLSFVRMTTNATIHAASRNPLASATSSQAFDVNYPLIRSNKWRDRR